MKIVENPSIYTKEPLTATPTCSLRKKKTNPRSEQLLHALYVKKKLILGLNLNTRISFFRQREHTTTINRSFSLQEIIHNNFNNLVFIGRSPKKLRMTSFLYSRNVWCDKSGT